MFTTHQLQINFRSNQEILDFANVALSNIEANQYANIQLRANSLARVTEKSFVEKVRFKYHRLAKISDFADVFSTIMANDIKPYIDEKMKLKEQVAFLAFTRRDIARFETSLKSLYPNCKIANLVPDKMYNTTIFSTFIKKYWDEVKFVQTKNIMYIIGRLLTSKLKYIVYDEKNALPTVQKMLSSWYTDEGGVVQNWQTQYTNGVLSYDDMMENIKTNMLQFEIKNNAIKQALLSARNQEAKNQQNAADADFVLSTIHSAKGLEFDNVVVIYRNDNQIDEEKKRMYYVAFTRAMKSEYILAYDVLANPAIEGDYNTIVKTLHDKNAAIQAKRAATIAAKNAPAAASSANIPDAESITNPSDIAN